MSSNGRGHGVPGQALGYVYQCFWALVELGKRAAADPDVELRLECLDDIQFDADGAPIELLQTKHHLGTSTPLSAAAVDVWRTLNVWMDLPSERAVVLRLITTQTVGTDPTLAALRSGSERDSQTALAGLLEVAEGSENATTAPWRKKLIDMDETDRSALVDRIVVDDNTRPATSLDDEIVNVFRYAIPVGREEVFTELLKGWWAGISVRLLASSLPSIQGSDLIAQVNDIADQLKIDSLPVGPSVLDPVDVAVLDSYDGRLFVQQLLWIALDNARLLKCIRDYHRSYTQRSYWLRHQLVSETELDRFAFLLHDEWEQVFDSKVAEMRRVGRLDSDIVGQEVLELMARESRARIRERFDQPWFNRGTLHALAEGEFGKRVGWHPEFEIKLEEVLSDVSG